MGCLVIGKKVEIIDGRKFGLYLSIYLSVHSACFPGPLIREYGRMTAMQWCAAEKEEEKIKIK